MQSNTVQIKKPFKRKRRKINIGMLIASIIFGIYAFSLMIPIIWGFIMSFQTRIAYITDKVSFPNPMRFQNYVDAFVELEATGSNMIVMIFNSTWYSVGSPLVGVFTTMMASYVCAKYKFILNKVMYWIAIIIMMPTILRCTRSKITLNLFKHV